MSLPADDETEYKCFWLTKIYLFIYLFNQGSSFNLQHFMFFSAEGQIDHTYMDSGMMTPRGSKMKKSTVLIAIGFIICVICVGIAAYFLADTVFINASVNQGKFYKYLC